MTGTTLPRRFDEHLPRIRETLSGATELLVCLDFDGTLAPIVDDPDDAAALPANERAVSRLASEPAVTTAVVSGRALDDVYGRVDGPTVYAGNHGLELARDGSVAIHPVARKRAASIAAVCSTLETVLDPVPNSRIENKRLTGTVHTRTVPDTLWPTVRRHTERVVDRIAGDDLEVSTGKRVLEIGPSIPWGKGNAVELIAAERPPETTTIYIGDDVTDESAFGAVEPDGIGVHVGNDEQSAASYRVQSPDEVSALLHWLAASGVELIDGPTDRATSRPAATSERFPGTDIALEQSAESAGD
ncbi:trehalose-phosphatase [Natrialbaceae archaeon A-arb3/5]